MIIISLLAYNLYIHCVTVYENVGIFHKVSIILQHHVEILLWYIFAVCSCDTGFTLSHSKDHMCCDAFNRTPESHGFSREYDKNTNVPR